MIHNAFRDRPCIVYGSDMKVRVEQANLFRYTDISALCGPIDFYDEEEDVYSNPQFIGEVISKSTEVYDRGDKFALYRLIESFTEYLLVDPDEMRVERFVRQRGNRWAGETYGAAEDQVVLSSIQVSFSLAELYEKVEFPPADKG